MVIAVPGLIGSYLMINVCHISTAVASHVAVSVDFVGFDYSVVLCICVIWLWRQSKWYPVFYDRGSLSTSEIFVL